MIKQWKYWLVAIITVGSFIAGRMTSKPQVVEKIVEVEKVVEVVKNKVRDRTITTTKKDGTTIVVTDKTREDTVVTENLTQKTNEVVAKKNRRLGVSVVAPKIFNLQSDNLDYRIEYGHRVFSDVWVTGGFQIKDKSISLGVSHDF